MNAYIFPGQGAQFSGMGLDLYENSPLAQELFEKANTILGFSITDVMFEGSADELKQTKVSCTGVPRVVTKNLTQKKDKMKREMKKIRQRKK